MKIFTVFTDITESKTVSQQKIQDCKENRTEAKTL